MITKHDFVSEMDKVKKEHYLIKQYSIYIQFVFIKLIFFKYRTREIKTPETSTKLLN